MEERTGKRYTSGYRVGFDDGRVSRIARGGAAGEPVESDSRGSAIIFGTSCESRDNRPVNTDSGWNGVNYHEHEWQRRSSALSATSELIVSPGGITNVLNAATDTSSPLGVSGLA
jgi:hypothetical protein